MEIIGIYGKLEKEVVKNKYGRKFSSKNFASIGFILNQCEKSKLKSFYKDFVLQKQIEDK